MSSFWFPFVLGLICAAPVASVITNMVIWRGIDRVLRETTPNYLE